MAYKPKNYKSLIGTPGFSREMLESHFNLYEGYVTNTNLLMDLIGPEASEDPSGLARAELRRRLSWEFNGMRLHELYFGNIRKGGSHLSPSGLLAKKITEDFGSLKAWENDFKAAGAMRGIGWVILAHDKTEDKLFNVWISEHDGGHLAGAEPLLVMDVFEHAFLMDYGLDRAEYVKAFFEAIDWVVVVKRLE